MNAKLARVLVQRGVIRQGTILDAYQSAKGLSCVCDSYSLSRYVVIGARASGDYVFFDVLTSAQDHQRVRNDYVATVDGMAIDRVAMAHQLRADGSLVPPLSRRGHNRQAAK